MKVYSLFSGGGGFDLGAHAAGCTTLGFELEDKIASVARLNKLDVMTADVRHVDWSACAGPDYLHASPPCTNASQANQDAGETPLDMELARAVCAALLTWRPPAFSLENVYGYRNFEAFKLIVQTLRSLGYHVGYWHLNAADYGVPQTRQRLILLASRVGRVRVPEPTHAETRTSSQGMLAGMDPYRLPAWNGWYDAIADLVPTLPTTDFADWQWAKLPAELTSMLVAGGGQSEYRAAHEPAMTVVNGSYRNRAFVVDGKANSYGDSVTVRHGHTPYFTVPASAGQQAARASVLGRIVRITDECLARFQTFPNDYQLPTSKALATRIIGNAVPCELARHMTMEIHRVLNGGL